MHTTIPRHDRLRPLLMPTLIVLALGMVLGACGNRSRSASSDCVPDGSALVCDVTGYPDRPYIVFVPSTGTDGPLPVVVELHGGGGKADPSSTCPDGNVEDPRCLHGVGSTEGFITVYPSGTGFRPLREVRTWNAGGGVDGWNCSSGKACEEGIDDLSYIDAVLENLTLRFPVDASRITVTGHSNGAAMSHRLACERADVFAAIVANSGSNQYSTGAPCEPARPISVMQIHGTDDPCWTYETSGRACLTSHDLKLGAVESAEGWAATDGCSTKKEGAVIDNEPDQTAIQLTTWSGCNGGTEVVLLTVIGGGHTWPNGDPGLGRVVGEISTEIDSRTIWDFLSRWSLP